MLETHPKATREVTDPALGGGKERSVTYESHLCKTAQEIDRVLNQDKYAYNYIYWNSHPDGVMITICKPNPLAFTQRTEKKIQRGLLELSEQEATMTTKALWGNCAKENTLDADISLIIGILYENGFKISRQVDEKVNP